MPNLLLDAMFSLLALLTSPKSVNDEEAKDTDSDEAMSWAWLANHEPTGRRTKHKIGTDNFPKVNSRVSC